MIPIENLLTHKAYATIAALAPDERKTELARIEHAYKTASQLPPEIDAAVYKIAVQRTRDKTTYAQYLKSAHWRRFRARKLKLVQNKCQDCNKYRRAPQLHHLTYTRLGHEKIDDVLALCGRCHMKRHKRRRKRR